jgi:hypothetical protein
VNSDLDITVPRGLAVFRAGGARQFFHGGLSPQELMVPVIEVDLTPTADNQQAQITVSAAGGRVTTGVFSVSVAFDGHLFTDTVTLRAVALSDDRHIVARVVAGDGFDSDTGTVTLINQTASVLTFQVTGNLAAGSSIEVQVLDARTGRQLASQVVPVVGNVIVEDSLD